jgi:predicted nucleotidyltransferase
MEQITKYKNSYLPLIVTKLKNIGIHKIILFGSQASGDVQLDSDIDLIVVTNDEYLPKSYKEKSDVYLKVSRALVDFTGKIPIDLIVYTKPMYNKFNELGSLFSKEISQKGVVLYESDN